MFSPASADDRTAAFSGRRRGRSLWEERSDRELKDKISRLISPGAADSSSRVGVSDRRRQEPAWPKLRRQSEVREAAFLVPSVRQSNMVGANA